MRRKIYQGITFAVVLLILGGLLIVTGAAVQLYTTFINAELIQRVVRDGMERGYTIEFGTNIGSSGRINASSSFWSIIPSHNTVIWARLTRPSDGPEWFQPHPNMPPITPQGSEPVVV